MRGPEAAQGVPLAGSPGSLQLLPLRSLAGRCPRRDARPQQRRLQNPLRRCVRRSSHFSVKLIYTAGRPRRPHILNPFAADASCLVAPTPAQLARTTWEHCGVETVIGLTASTAADAPQRAAALLGDGSPLLLVRSSHPFPTTTTPTTTTAAAPPSSALGLRSVSTTGGGASTQRASGLPPRAPLPGRAASPREWQPHGDAPDAPAATTAAAAAARCAAREVPQVSALLQSGVLRTNCVDCLDRTNVAQFAFGAVALGHALVMLGFADSHLLDLDSGIGAQLMEMYQAMGDSLAMQYGGSEAHNPGAVLGGSGAKRGAWRSAGFSREMMTSVRRFYSNNYTDADKQDAINLFLGHFIPERGRPTLWELDSDYYLHSDLRGAQSSEALASLSSVLGNSLSFSSLAAAALAGKGKNGPGLRGEDGGTEQWGVAELLSPSSGPGAVLAAARPCPLWPEADETTTAHDTFTDGTDPLLSFDDLSESPWAFPRATRLHTNAAGAGGFTWPQMGPPVPAMAEPRPPPEVEAARAAVERRARTYARYCGPAEESVGLGTDLSQGVREVEDVLRTDEELWDDLFRSLDRDDDARSSVEGGGGGAGAAGDGLGGEGGGGGGGGGGQWVAPVRVLSQHHTGQVGTPPRRGAPHHPFAQGNSQYSPSQRGPRHSNTGATVRRGTRTPGNGGGAHALSDILRVIQPLDC